MPTIHGRYKQKSIGPRNKAVMKLPLEEIQDLARKGIRQCLSEYPDPTEWVGEVFIPCLLRGSYDLGLRRKVGPKLEDSGWKGREGIRYQSYQGTTYKEAGLVTTLYTDWDLWERWVLSLNPSERALKRVFAWMVYSKGDQSTLDLEGVLQ